MNIHEKLIQEGIRVNSQQEQQKVLCPKCSHTRRKNRSEPCLSVNLQDDIAMWHCHHCDWKGSVHEDVKGFKPKPVVKNNVVNIGHIDLRKEKDFFRKVDTIKAKIIELDNKYKFKSVAIEEPSPNRSKKNMKPAPNQKT